MTTDVLQDSSTKDAFNFRVRRLPIKKLGLNHPNRLLYHNPEKDILFGLTFEFTRTTDAFSIGDMRADNGWTLTKTPELLLSDEFPKDLVVYGFTHRIHMRNLSSSLTGHGFYRLKCETQRVTSRMDEDFVPGNKVDFTGASTMDRLEPTSRYYILLKRPEPVQKRHTLSRRFVYANGNSSAITFDYDEIMAFIVGKNVPFGLMRRYLMTQKPKNWNAKW